MFTSEEKFFNLNFAIHGNKYTQKLKANGFCFVDVV